MERPAAVDPAVQDRLVAHVETLAQLAGQIDDGITPEFVEACEAEHRFLVDELLPHMRTVEETLYGELERVMEGRHTMAPMRREHAELRRLVESAGAYHELVTSGELGPSEAMGLRRALYRLYAMLRVHLAEEALYLRVLERGLTDEGKDELARGIARAGEEPL